MDMGAANIQKDSTIHLVVQEASVPDASMAPVGKRVREADAAKVAVLPGSDSDGVVEVAPKAAKSALTSPATPCSSDPYMNEGLATLESALASMPLPSDLPP